MERIDKIIASQGKYSRSEVKKLVKDGRVTLDGKVIKSSDVKADPDLNDIAVDGKIIEKDAEVLVESIEGVKLIVTAR